MDSRHRRNKDLSAGLPDEKQQLDELIADLRGRSGQIGDAKDDLKTRLAGLTTRDKDIEEIDPEELAAMP